MKAVLCTRYGPPEVLQLIEIDKPAPGDHDVLIKIYASTVTMGDCELRTLTLPLWTRIPLRLYMGYKKPRRFIPGMEFSGIVEAVGEKVTSFKKGDAVFGSGRRSIPGKKCSLSGQGEVLVPVEYSLQNYMVLK